MRDHNRREAQPALFRAVAILLMGLAAMITGGCNSERDADDGELTNFIKLPTDVVLNLYCENVGIADEACVLDDPENPYATTTIRSGASAAIRATASGWRAFSGWKTGIPRRTASSFTGGDAIDRPRPAGRSGLHRTRVTSTASARAAREETANHGVPMNTVRNRSAPGPADRRITSRRPPRRRKRAR